MNGIVTHGEFELFRDLIYEKAGIRLRESRRTLVAQRLEKRLATYGMSCYSQYYKLLTNAPDGRDEMQEFINALTTNETYFYRHPEQFNHLTDALIPELLAKKPAGSRPALRIWSAGCASGEEPYSIAIQIRESRIPADSCSLEIIGSDINHVMIQKTRTRLLIHATGRDNRSSRPVFHQGTGRGCHTAVAVIGKWSVITRRISGPFSMERLTIFVAMSDLLRSEDKGPCAVQSTES
jgi:chemotaxis methyl-accepting protein methylase